MTVTKVDPLSQVWNSDSYDDTLTTGAALESPAAADQNLEHDLNALRTLIRLAIGQADWYTAPADNFGLKQIHDKMFAYLMPWRSTGANASQFTLGGAASGVLLDASMFDGGAGTIAVGAASTEDGGYIAADEANFTVAGTLGVGLSQATDGDGVLLNVVHLMDDATNVAPETIDGEEIFGLMQTITGTGDGASIAAAASENLQLSFVYIDKDTDAITATTLPAGTYDFAPARQRDFQSLNRGFTLGGSAPATVDAGAVIVRPQHREFDITGTTPLADDPMNVNTGSFTTAGAQTTFSSFGTCALPASGADFRDDARVKIWRNGVLQSKGAGAGDNRDVYWVSATQIAFEDKLTTGKNVIRIETPASF